MTGTSSLTIAEIFDRAVTLVVRRWRTVLILCLIAAVPDVLMKLLLRGRSPNVAETVLGFAVDSLVYALPFAAFVHAIAEDDAPHSIAQLLRRALRDYPRSLGAFVLLDALLIVVALAAAGIILMSARAGVAIAGRTGGLVAGPLTALALLIVVLPFFTVFSIAYPTTILEGLSPWRALTTAAARALRRDLRRSWLLGAGLIVVSVGPFIVFDTALGQLASIPGLAWTPALGPLLEAVTGVAYGTALGVVAAIDYRNRREGADLHAVLDTASPA